MKTFAIAGLFLLASVGVSAQTQTMHPPKNVSAPTPSVTQVKIDPAKEADIRHLLDVTGGASVATQLMDGMEKSIRPLMTNALPPGEYREQLVELFFQKYHEKRDPQRIVDIAVPVYDKYYSDDEIKQLAQFYSTPLGKKVLSVMPKLTGELQKAGSDYGEDLGRQSMLEVLVQHPDLAKALDQAKKAQQAPQQ